MESYKQLLLDEIQEFREKGHKFLNKEISKADFKHTSGGMGVYAQRDGQHFMIRLRVASGILNLEQLKLVQGFVHKYNLQQIHLTTRQAIQLHTITIDEVCDIMEEGIHKGIYTRGSGGNFPRNVAISPLSGVDPEDVFDVTPYATKVNEHFMSKITTYKLPRKLKVAFSSSPKDESKATINDLGFMAVKKDKKEYFKVYIAGGMGKNPMKGCEYDELVEPKDVLYHVEAMTNLFIEKGNYENKNKARTRYILMEMGKDALLECYKKHLKEVKEKHNLDISVVQKVYDKKGIKIDITDDRLVEQRQEGLYSVYVHPVNGQLKSSDLDKIIDTVNNMEDIEIRLAMSEGLYIRNLNGEEAKLVLDITKDITGKYKIQQSTACIGVPICQIGIVESQETLEEIINYLKEKNYNSDNLPRIHISGCPNSCSAHQVAPIGFAGKKKKVEDKTQDAFEIHIGGRASLDETRLGKVHGDVLRKDVPCLLYDISESLAKSNLEFYEYIEKNEDELNNIVNKYLV
ncbi:nitrite/sulfite reductase [Paraclostridium ghonii]|uniref:nitrite/sulfite reductase n=1 Tax=Paraclostridium ghonii TaxID=29358 RepID=UPI00202CD94B|nr:nitrite/sulfite reductase [Paeniclostridium ghonii]MCM0167219.1 nitrite/sulfite reductase [Paeniclostridium ghonii]